MCGRYVLKAPPAELVTKFGLDECVDFMPRYNIAPGTDIPAIFLSHEGKRILHLLHWGLIPHWAKDPSIQHKLINARGESVAEKPSFRTAFKRHRCLIPASGFYEWKQDGKVKQPYYITLKSGEPMAIAGLWESWVAPEGGTINTTCIVTIGANALMKTIHERMPVLIAAGNWQDWLSGPPDDAKSLIAPYDSNRMEAWAVSKTVNKPTVESASLIEKV